VRFNEKWSDTSTSILLQVYPFITGLPETQGKMARILRPHLVKRMVTPSVQTHIFDKLLTNKLKTIGESIAFNGGPSQHTIEPDQRESFNNWVKQTYFSLNIEDYRDHANMYDSVGDLSIDKKTIECQDVTKYTIQKLESVSGTERLLVHSGFQLVSDLLRCG
jgi:hypothetical protein